MPYEPVWVRGWEEKIECHTNLFGWEDGRRKSNAIRTCLGGRMGGENRMPYEPVWVGGWEEKIECHTNLFGWEDGRRKLNSTTHNPPSSW